VTTLRYVWARTCHGKALRRWGAHKIANTNPRTSILNTHTFPNLHNPRGPPSSAKAFPRGRSGHRPRHHARPDRQRPGGPTAPGRPASTCFLFAPSRRHRFLHRRRPQAARRQGRSRYLVPRLIRSPRSGRRPAAGRRWATEAYGNFVEQVRKVVGSPASCGTSASGLTASVRIDSHRAGRFVRGPPRAQKKIAARSLGVRRFRRDSGERPRGGGRNSSGGACLVKLMLQLLLELTTGPAPSAACRHARHPALTRSVPTPPEDASCRETETGSDPKDVSTHRPGPR